MSETNSKGQEKPKEDNPTQNQNQAGNKPPKKEPPKEEPVKETLKEKKETEVSVPASELGAAIGEGIKNALQEMESNKLKPESTRLQEQRDSIARMRQEQILDLTRDEEDRSYKLIDSSTGKIRVKSTEAHLVHVKVMKKEHDPIKKEYYKIERILKQAPAVYNNHVLTGGFKTFDGEEILHDPRTEAQKRALKDGLDKLAKQRAKVETSNS